MARATKSPKLRGKHILAMTKLIKGEPVRQIAKDLRVQPDTIYAWTRNPAFQARQLQYLESIANEELDRGLQDAAVALHESASIIVNWMTQVVTGQIELKNERRWRQALDFLHHAGIIDQNAASKAQAPGPSLNLTLDQRRQQILSTGNTELQHQLERFNPPQA